MPTKDPHARRATNREAQQRRRDAKRLPQALAIPTPVLSSWSPRLGASPIPLRSAGDELAACEMIADVALNCPDDLFPMMCARGRLLAIAVQQASRSREDLAFAAGASDPRSTFEYALAVASAALHDENIAARCAEHRTAIAAGQTPAPLDLESGYDKFGLGDPKWGGRR